MDVRGKLIKLSEDRLVYVGTDRSGETSGYYIAFRSHTSIDTKLSLTAEATDAMRKALADCHAGDDVFPHKAKWRVVEFTKDEQ